MELTGKVKRVTVMPDMTCTVDVTLVDLNGTQHDLCIYDHSYLVRALRKRSLSPDRNIYGREDHERYLGAVLKAYRGGLMVTVEAIGKTIVSVSFINHV